MHLTNKNSWMSLIVPSATEFIHGLTFIGEKQYEQEQTPDHGGMQRFWVVNDSRRCKEE
jgi:hypothetical protein